MGDKQKGVAYFFSTDEVRDWDYDIGHLSTIFQRTFGFEWMNDRCYQKFTKRMWNHERDPTSEKDFNLDCCIMCSIKSMDFSDTKYFVFGVTSHGEESNGQQCLVMQDKQLLWVNDVMEDLHGARSLKGIIKILIINACRIDYANREKAADRGVLTHYIAGEKDCKKEFSSTEPLPPEQDHPTGCCSSKGSQTPPLNSTELVPFPYFLIVQSTTPGRYSINSGESGSWMLKELGDVIQESVYERQTTRISLLHALTEAAERMSRRESRSKSADYVGLKNILNISHSLSSLPILKVRDREESQPIPNLLSD